MSKYFRACIFSNDFGAIFEIRLWRMLRVWRVVAFMKFLSKISAILLLDKSKTVSTFSSLEKMKKISIEKSFIVAKVVMNWSWIHYHLTRASPWQTTNNRIAIRIIIADDANWFIRNLTVDSNQSVAAILCRPINHKMFKSSRHWSRNYWFICVYLQS